MQKNSLFFSCLAPRSSDTIETLVNKQRMYEIKPDNPTAVIYPCSNLQKKLTSGLSGIMTEFGGSTILHTLDTITDNIFCGISVVKCTVPDTTNIENLNDKLIQYMKKKEENTNMKKSVVLEQVLPNNQTFDFWWLNQSCEFKGGLQMQECIFQDYKTNVVNFYDAYTCIDNDNSADDIDKTQKDANCWDTILRGSIGLYVQENVSQKDFFFVCISDFASVASDIVRSIKSDIGNKTNIFDFCSSKEMWFLRNISLRNRLRLILEVSEFLEIPVDKQYDMYANERCADPNMAIEVCGVELHHTECAQHMNSCTGEMTQSVFYYQSCVDAKKHKSLLPVYLGDTTGLIIFSPLKIENGLFANHTESPAFVNNTIANKAYLFPVTNIFESDISNIKKIQTENKNLLYLTIEDILFHMHQYHNVFDSSLIQTLKSKNEYGESLFYGTRHDIIKSLIIIYPKHVASFIQCMSTNNNTKKTPTSISLKTPLSIKNKTVVAAPIRYTTITKTISRDFTIDEEYKVHDEALFCYDNDTQKAQYDQNTVSLEWDDAVISNVQKMSMINNHRTDSLKLTPVIFYKNFIH